MFGQHMIQPAESSKPGGEDLKFSPTFARWKRSVSAPRALGSDARWGATRAGGDAPRAGCDPQIMGRRITHHDSQS